VSQLCGPPRPVTGIALLFYINHCMWLHTLRIHDHIRDHLSLRCPAYPEGEGRRFLPNQTMWRHILQGRRENLSPRLMNISLGSREVCPYAFPAIPIPLEVLSIITDTNQHCRAGSEVLRAGVMKTIFWDITPCSSLKVDRRFRGTNNLHLRRHLATCFYAGTLRGLFFDPEYGC
jgi:hypothetical protein